MDAGQLGVSSQVINTVVNVAIFVSGRVAGSVLDYCMYALPQDDVQRQPMRAAQHIHAHGGCGRRASSCLIPGHGCSRLRGKLLPLAASGMRSLPLCSPGSARHRLGCKREERGGGGSDAVVARLL